MEGIKVKQDFEPVAWQYSYEMWDGGWSTWSRPQFEKPTNPEFRIRPLYDEVVYEKLIMAYGALRKIMDISDSDCERYVRSADTIACEAIALLES